MLSKIQKITELEHILSDKTKTAEGVASLISKFNIASLLKPFEHVKSKGFKLSMLIPVLSVFRLMGYNIRRGQALCNKAYFEGDENSLYRLMNNSLMDWRRLLATFAKQFKAIVEASGDAGNKSLVKCFIIDDTLLEKTGKTIEYIGKVFDHVTKRYLLGFKLLALGYWDGKSLIANDFSLHAEKGAKGNQGMTSKELKARFSKKRDKASPGGKRAGELDQKKTEAAVSMIKRAVKNGFIASYLLMDSWFVNDYMIKSIRSIKSGAIHVLGMCKLDNRKFEINGREMCSAQIIRRNERDKGHYSRKHRSRYIQVVGSYKGEKVKLFYIKYQNSKEWALLLTTDLSIKFARAIELYQIRWTIEVMFKECKQYLELGGFQGTDFDGQIADASIAFITHTMLTLQRRFFAYETMGELFRESQLGLLELNLWERILQVFIKILRQLLELLNIDMDETIGRLLGDKKTEKKIMAILELLDENNEKKLKLAA